MRDSSAMMTAVHLGCEHRHGPRAQARISPGRAYVSGLICNPLAIGAVGGFCADTMLITVVGSSCLCTRRHMPFEMIKDRRNCCPNTLVVRP